MISLEWVRGMRPIAALTILVSGLWAGALLADADPAVDVAAASASDQTTAKTVDFVRDVRPIFEQHCYACHGAAKQRSGFRLDIKAAAFQGGDAYGPSIVPRDPATSPLVELISSTDLKTRMPPEGPGLSAADQATITRWIQQGAVWPDGVDQATLVDKRDHWSFHPRTQPAVPATVTPDWACSALDRFILARLEAEGLSPAPAADRVSWLRRVSYDLIGLPPTPEQVTAFVADSRPDAFERVVTELLDSPRYGERWAQHWLDVVRYADTHGFEVNTERPYAWPYRDYVIRALNADLPYDQFIRQQIVGDQLDPEAGAATGFLITASVLLPGQIGADDASKRLARQDSLDEIVVNLGQTFLGLSVGCARCHDHKFDPVSQADYYSMQAFVAGVEYADRKLETATARQSREAAARNAAQLQQLERRLTKFVPLAHSGVTRPTINAKKNVDRFPTAWTKRVRFTIEATNRLEPCLDELEVWNTAGKNVALAAAGATVSASGSTVAADCHELRFVNDGLYGNTRSWMSSEVGRGWVVVEFPSLEEVELVIWGRDREGKYDDRLATEYRIEIADENGEWRMVADGTDRSTMPTPATPANETLLQGLSPQEQSAARALMTEKAALEDQVQRAEREQLAFAGTFRAPDEIRVLSRGDPEQPKGRVPPSVPEALGNLQLSLDAPESERRRALAEWIADPANPLTARVIANRVWQWHFGTGLVATPSDFGRSGLPPSHPELLDWLANELIEHGWSLKHLHRLIVLSSTYRQSHRAENSRAQDRDAEVRLLWRFPAKRLDAECIRDGMLAISGQLNLTMYGRGFDLFDQRGGLTGFNPVETLTPANQRRMIYAHKVRRERDATFGAFDCPDAGQSTAVRSESTTPIQALNLFNSRFTLATSTTFAERVQREVGDDPAAQIRRAYWLALSRDAAASEVAVAEPLVREHGLAVLCRALFNSNEFLFQP